MTLRETFRALFRWREPRGALPRDQREERRVCETEAQRLARISKVPR